MRKLLFLLIILAFPLFYAKDANAAILHVDNEGEVIWNVLSYNNLLALGVNERNELEVKDVADSSVSKNDLISLRKEDDKILLEVDGEDGGKEIDVTSLGNDLVEIEERGDVRKVKIGLVDNKFAIEQNGIVATTEFPLKIDPKENTISLQTASGDIFLSILPVEAAETALRSKYISNVSGNNFNITQRDVGVLTYEVGGERVIKIFNIINYGVEVKAYISASTGEVIFVEQPTWLKILGVLMV